MYFRHIYEKGLAQASYIIGCQATKEAIVVDPRRDIQEYLDIAEKEKLEIKYVTETHIHADFLSGSRELAAATGAELLLSAEGGTEWQYQFDHKSLTNGDKIKVGNIQLEVVHTPGHTPEHISFLVYDLPATDKPIMILTGDFVFAGDVGRPDLLEKAAGIAGTQLQGAKQMYNSLKWFRSLPDYVQVWPGHGAGSACGKALGAVPASTVGYEKLVNWALNIHSEDKFTETLLQGQPEPPRYFAMMKRLNKSGAEILGSIPLPAKLSINLFRKAFEQNIIIVDTRDKLAFAGGHLPGSINIQDNSSFSTWAGWLLDYENPLILVTSEERIQELTKSLIRIGLDNIYGYVSDLGQLSGNGFELETVNQITPNELYKNRDEYLVIDVRGYTEYDEAHIPGAINIHTGYIVENLHKIPADRKIAIHCTSGDRSGIASSLLIKHGYKNIYNLTSGINGWIQSGFKTETSQPVEMQVQN
ncbi:MAG: MBL fold hydrolase [Ignavibacteriaceae bacterium]